MPRERDYPEEYRRRMEGAPQGDDLYASEQREWLRGHRGESYLRDYAREGDAVQVGDERDSAGRFTTLHLYPDDPAREPRVISIRGMSTADVRDLLDDLEDQGVAVSAGYLEE